MRKQCGGILGTRSSALWGRGGKMRIVALMALTVAFAVPASSSAGGGRHHALPTQGIVPADLIASAQANPAQLFHVIVQGTKGNSSSRLATDVADQTGVRQVGGKDRDGRLKHSFRSINGVAVSLTGKDLLRLAKNPHVLAITPDSPVASSDYQDGEMWRSTADIASLWNVTDPYTGEAVGPAPQAPTVALVDSGVDTSKVEDFGGRLIASVDLSSLSPNSTADEEGHGTMVAGILAGSSPDHPGVAENAPIVSVKTADANGQSLTSDVIAAADWILANKNTYDIRVANFSMAGATPVSFRFDPLDQAVERLWFSGIVVVAAAGNHGSADGPVDMSYAPGNDPFVITVGATDQMQTSDPTDDTIPYWSAYGSTMDGFSKPDLVAPGRYMVAPVPMDSTIPATVPDRVVAPGYMWMSGTSFAAPVVSGAAAQILALHPDWSPDQVKGALMLTSNYLANAGPQAGGVGEVDAAAAASLPFDPPNPNENLDAFVKADPTTGGPVFDQVSWASAASSAVSWSSADWAAAIWASASWNAVSWASVSWNSVSWSSDVNSAMQSLVSWSEVSWSEVSWAE